MKPEWRIYYSDGSTFDSLDGAPESAPPFSVQAIVQKDRVFGRRILRMVDYFAFSPKEQRWLDLFDASAVIVRSLRDPGLIIKSGEYINERQYEEILKKATNDPDFPGKAPRERSIMGRIDG